MHTFLYGSRTELELVELEAVDVLSPEQMRLLFLCAVSLTASAARVDFNVTPAYLLNKSRLHFMWYLLFRHSLTPSGAPEL